MWQFLLWLIVALFFTGLATVSGYKAKEAWDKHHIHGKENALPKVSAVAQAVAPNESKTENAEKIAKVKINRILEDAHSWLPKHKDFFVNETNRIVNDAINRGMGSSGPHVVLHVRKVNDFIEAIDDYLKEMNRNIQDLLLEIGEDSLVSASNFEAQKQEFVDFKKLTEDTIDWAKKQNYATCLKFTDKQTLDNIFKSKRYIR